MERINLSPESCDLIGRTLANHMTSINADYNMISTALHDFYIDGAEMVLLFADIPHSFNKSDDRKRYVSVTLDGKTFPVPGVEDLP